jgi:UAA transporter family.
MMVAMNKWSCLFLGISILITGEIFEFINFVNKYPSIIYQLFLFSVLSALGQFFIFLTVTEYGPLPCSIVTTTRKFFTVLGSIIFFGNVMTSRQWIATFIVFTGLFLDSFYSSKESAKRRQ